MINPVLNDALVLVLNYVCSHSIEPRQYDLWENVPCIAALLQVEHHQERTRTKAPLQVSFPSLSSCFVTTATHLSLLSLYCTSLGFWSSHVTSGNHWLTMVSHQITRLLRTRSLKIPVLHTSSMRAILRFPLTVLLYSLPHSKRYSKQWVHHYLYICLIKWIIWILTVHWMGWG